MNKTTIRKILVLGAIKTLKAYIEVVPEKEREEVLKFAVTRRFKTTEQLDIMRAFGFRYS